MKKMTAALVFVCAALGAFAQKSPYFDGDGGRGKSITIHVPEAKGLPKDQDYFTTLVQGEFVSNFSHYSALAVRDRAELDNVYKDLFSGGYDDYDKALEDFGHLSSTDYMLGGSITKTASGYALQIKITRTADKTTAASYSGTCTFAELDNLSGVRRASLDLLQKLGVKPTALALAELGRAADKNHVSAQTALSQGIVSQWSGNTIATLASFYEAAEYDPSLKEAAARLNTLASTVRTGSLGQDIRNDIAWRKEWIKLLEEADAYTRGLALPPLPPPETFVELVYAVNLKQGKVDYEKETVDFTLKARFHLLSVSRPPSAALRVLEDLEKGLLATRRNSVWKLQIPWKNKFSKLAYSYNYSYTAQLINSAGNTVGKGQAGSARLSVNAGEHYGGAYSGSVFIRFDDGPSTAWAGSDITFHVNAADITDAMTVKITSTSIDNRSGPNLVPVMTVDEYRARSGGYPPADVFR
jgi:hypothetical protein